MTHNPARPDPPLDVVAERRAAVVGLIEALNKLDFDAVELLLSPDSVFETPFGPRLVVEGRSAVLANLRRYVGGVFSPMTLMLDEVHIFADADGAVAQYHSSATVRKSGQPYNNDYVGVFEFTDGQLSRWQEYFDPTRLPWPAS